MKKLFIILIVSCSLLIVNCFAQSITWQRTYQSQFNSHEHGRDICNAPGGNFYIVGYVEIPSYIYVLQINKYGDTIWTKLISGSSAIQRAYTCTMSNDSGVVITGRWTDSVFTIKLDRDGNIIWQKFYPPLSGMVQLYDIISTSDGGYIACGDAYNTSNISYVIKIDSSGDLQWQKVYPALNYRKFFGVIEALDSGFVFCGKAQDSFTDTNSMNIFKTNSIGDLVWEKRYSVNNGGGYFNCNNRK